jgi:NodT family efflux transporter outer membrane factor (OMF) lipoprotein
MNNLPALNGRNARAWIAGAALLLCGCTLGPDFVRPKAPDAEHYNRGGDPVETVAAGGGAQRFEQGAAPVADWWKMFGSAELDAVLAEGLANNPGVQAAQASLRQSNDNLQAGYGVFYPQVGASFSPTRQLFSPARIGSPAPGNLFNLVTLSASVGYTFDIFGGERRAVESLAAQRDMQRGELLGTYLALSGNIVNTTIAMAAYKEELGLTEQLIALQKEQVAITETQNRAGTVAYAPVLELQGQVAAAEAQLPPLRQKLDQSAHLLATLAGRAPSEWSPPDVALSGLKLPAKLPLSLPSELVKSRPDIIAAEAEMHSASANIGVARAAQFPSFTLNGSYGQNSTSMGTLFNGASNFWSLGPNIGATLFDGGTLAARKQAAVDVYQQSEALYRQTVLAAFQQVADAVRALQHDAETMQAQADAVQAAAETLRLARINYQAGTANYLQVLAADIAHRQARLAYVEAQALRLQDTSALLIALGGPWKDAP